MFHSAKRSFTGSRKVTRRRPTRQRPLNGEEPSLYLVQFGREPGKHSGLRCDGARAPDSGPTSHGVPAYWAQEAYEHSLGEPLR